MKKSILIVALLIITILAAGQEHLKFKGIPIDGPLSSFVDKLISQGFTLIGTENDVALLKGKFAGWQCKVGAGMSNGVVWKVQVWFPEQETWASTKERYEELKESLSSKYGVCPTCTEKFPDYPVEGSGMEYLAFKDERAKWSSFFEVLPYGYINIAIESSIENSSRLRVVLEYYDGENTAKRISAITDDL